MFYVRARVRACVRVCVCARARACARACVWGGIANTRFCRYISLLLKLTLFLYHHFLYCYCSPQWNTSLISNHKTVPDIFNCDKGNIIHLHFHIGQQCFSLKIYHGPLKIYHGPLKIYHGPLKIYHGPLKWAQKYIPLGVHMHSIQSFYMSENCSFPSIRSQVRVTKINWMYLKTS